MKTATLGVLNALYGAICSWLFLIQTGKIVLWGFVENNKYTTLFFQVWEVVMFVLMILSGVLMFLNIKRQEKDNKLIFNALNVFIFVNIFGSIIFHAVAIFSFVILALSVALIFVSDKYRVRLKPVSKLKKW